MLLFHRSGKFFPKWGTTRTKSKFHWLTLRPPFRRCRFRPLLLPPHRQQTQAAAASSAAAAAAPPPARPAHSSQPSALRIVVAVTTTGSSKEALAESRPRRFRASHPYSPASASVTLYRDKLLHFDTPSSWSKVYTC